MKYLVTIINNQSEQYEVEAASKQSAEDIIQRFLDKGRVFPLPPGIEFAGESDPYWDIAESLTERLDE